MALSTYKTFLMKKEDSAFKKVIDIKNFPNLGGDPELLDATTLSNSNKVSISGIQSLDSFKFTANYEKEGFTKLKALEGKTEEYAVWFGGTGEGDSLVPTGTDGKFKFKGQLTVYVLGKEVNQVREMQISIAVSSDITTEA